jgi:hypothetical protein
LRWVRRTRVPFPWGSRSISTRVEPVGTAAIPSLGFSHPQVNTTRRSGTTSTYSPRMTSLPLGPSRWTPPGRGSISAWIPIQRSIFTARIVRGRKCLARDNQRLLRRLTRLAASCHGLRTVYEEIAMAFSLLAASSFLRISQFTAACTELFDNPMDSAIS